MSMTLGGIATDRVATLTAHEEEVFRSRRTRSRELWKEAIEYIPRGVPSSFQDTPPQPVFIDHGQGSKVWDVDGNEYVDFHNGFGVMVVGHAHPAIVAAVEAQMHRGSHFAQPGADNIVVARELARRFHQPQWRFTNSGAPTQWGRAPGFPAGSTSRSGVSPTAGPSRRSMRSASRGGSPIASES